jgi:hypothetical protein
MVWISLLHQSLFLGYVFHRIFTIINRFITQMKRKKTVSLIVLNYNGLHHLQEYFTSVYNQTLIPTEVIMMDNLSRDGSREFVKKHFPKVKIVTEDRYNTGTATGSNMGFAHTTGDLVIFQSNDLRLDKNCIKELVETITYDEKVGIVTSVFIKYERDPDGDYIVDNAGGLFDMYGFGIQNYPSVKFKDIPQEQEVFFSYGSSFIIRRDLFEKIGGFDDHFFTLHDDIDLSWRVRLLGYKILYTKKSFVYHKGSATIKQRGRAQKRYWSERNSIRSFIKNAELSHILKVAPMYIALLCGEMGYFLYRRKFALFFSDVKAIVWNLRYLPETLSLRRKIHALKKKNNIAEMLMPTSIKLKLFSGFKQTLCKY